MKPQGSIESLFSLEGKVALITGAAGYFGTAFSECLLFAGAKVILYARGTKIKDLAARLRDSYGEEKVDYSDVDLYDKAAYQSALEQTMKSNRAVDILVNNAFDFSVDTGFNDPSGRIENISGEQWLKSFESGVFWHALSTQIVGQRMMEQKSGSIINLSSMYATVAPDPALYEGTDIINPPSYGAAKAAIEAFTKYTASFYGAYDVRCNAISPGPFPNPDPGAYNSPTDSDFMKRLSDRTVLGRTGELKDLQGVLIFLASNASSYITGQTIVVDGGWTIR